MTKIVITLGGNALQTKNSAPTAEAQLEADALVILTEVEKVCIN